mmetsp:Transcript_56884/g.128906  ORF Transcript_56884/g.128906 Transcript_56884/m.128906 type:complete len:227 (-) Transcript_56884:147-827(-)
MPLWSLAPRATACLASRSAGTKDAMGSSAPPPHAEPPHTAPASPKLPNQSPSLAPAPPRGTRARQSAGRMPRRLTKSTTCEATTSSSSGSILASKSSSQSTSSSTSSRSLASNPASSLAGTAPAPGAAKPTNSRHSSDPSDPSEAPELPGALPGGPRAGLGTPPLGAALFFCVAPSRTSRRTASWASRRPNSATRRRCSARHDSVHASEDDWSISRATTPQLLSMS